MSGVVHFGSRPDSCSGRFGMFTRRFFDDSVMLVKRAQFRYLLGPDRENSGRTPGCQPQPAPDDRSDPPRRDATRILLTESARELVCDVLHREPFAGASRYEIPNDREDLRLDALRSLLRELVVELRKFRDDQLPRHRIVDHREQRPEDLFEPRLEIAIGRAVRGPR